jgi:hypothetical protein
VLHDHPDRSVPILTDPFCTPVGRTALPLLPLAGQQTCGEPEDPRARRADSAAQASRSRRPIAASS